MNETLQVFLLILAASFIFSTLVSRIPLLRIPSAIGYLLFGILLHVDVITLSGDEMRWIDQLGDFGLLFLMFLSGLEVDVSLLQPQLWRKRGPGPNPVYLSISIFTSTMLISFLFSQILVFAGLGPAHPYMLTLLFATTSMGVILPILEENGTLQSTYGQTLLLASLMADLSTMLLVSLFVSVRSSGQVSDFLFALSIIPIALAVYFTANWSRGFPVVRALFPDIQSRMRAVIALISAFCALAEFTGSEPILGSFLVGILVSALPFAFKKRIKDYSHGVGYGFFVPVFFISVGLNFHFDSFRNPETWMWIVLLLGVAFVVKIIPSWQLRKHFGARGALAGGFLLSARLSLIVAAADIGVRIGTLPAFLGGAIIIVAVLTCLIAPILFVALAPSPLGD
ncbi:cation:proton antiporter [Alicyclobacillus sp. SO9]|uniref:cation:proton antiporter n=1 Tax=Alicyclobacillus sp. SO9 TaxID=2665646 RepID=UPI0018E8DD28|nr:cation:proton antiporter [Alicyclobacillus sp. SO9]QQE78047.1 cation:proton antiporter [Alicyclobacillus sp. SO9]